MKKFKSASVLPSLKPTGMKEVTIKSVTSPGDQWEADRDPTLPNPWYPAGTLAKYGPDGARIGTYNRNFYRIERRVQGIPPEDAEAIARDLLIRMLQQISPIASIPTVLRHDVGAFLGRAAMKKAGVKWPSLWNRK